MAEKGQYNNKRIAKNTLFLYIRMLFVLAISLYTSRVVLQVLGITDFGIYNVVAGFITLFSFLNTSLVGAIQRFYNYEKSVQGEDGVTKVYNASLIIQICLATIVFVLLETFGLWYLNNVMVIPKDRMFAAKILYQASVISSIIVIVQIPFSAAVVSFEKMDFYALVGIIDVVLKLVIVLILPFLFFDNLIAYGILLLIITIIDFLLYFIYSKRKFRALFFNRFYLEKRLFKSMLSFSGWNFVGTFSNLAFSQGLNLLLNFFFGPVVNAARGIATMVMNALHGFSINITVAFRPQLVESYANEDYSKTRQIMYSESKICYLMLFFLAVPIIIEINYILHLWLGDNVPDNTEIFTVLILIQMLFSSFNPAFTQVTHASGKLKKFQIITSIISLSVLPVSYVILKMGAEAYSVFIVSIVLTIISAFACMFLVKQVFRYSIRDYCFKVLLPALIITILSPIVPILISVLMPQSFIRLCIVIISSVICTCLWSYVILLDYKEKRFVIEKVSHFVKRK